MLLVATVIAMAAVIVAVEVVVLVEVETEVVWRAVVTRGRLLRRRGLHHRQRYKRYRGRATGTGRRWAARTRWNQPVRLQGLHPHSTHPPPHSKMGGQRLWLWPRCRSRALYRKRQAPYCGRGLHSRPKTP